MTATPTASPELLDLDRLEALARAATPGEWKAMPHGRVVGGPLRHYVNGSAKAQIASFGVTFHEQAPEDEPERQQANADFAAAANPEQVLALIALARRAQPEGEATQTACTVPPEGWYCTRAPGHDGPCAAWPVAHQDAAPSNSPEIPDGSTSAPGTPEAPADLPRLYRFDCYVGKTKMAAGVGVHASTMEEAEQKARKLIDKGETIKFESNQPCHPTRKCSICANYERAAQLDGGQEEGP